MSPLTRVSVTIASRVMLPADVVFFAVVGTSFVATPTHRLRETPSLRYLDDRVGVAFVGVAFLVFAAVLLFAMVEHRRALAQKALSVMALWLWIYAAANIAAAVVGQASWSAWAWPAHIGLGCWASLLSLEKRER